MLNEYEVTFTQPPVETFIKLRKLIGWGEINSELAKNSLEQSLYHVVISNNGHVVGIGRVVGDGAMYFYVQDIIIHPDYQGLGLGRKIMTHIEAYLAENAKKGATIGLLSAKGKEDFYGKFGYQIRPSDSLGHGMCKFV